MQEHCEGVAELREGVMVVGGCHDDEGEGLGGGHVGCALF